MDSIEFAKTHHSGVFVVANAIQVRTNTQKKTEGFVFIDMGYMHFILLGNHFILFRLNIIFYVCCFCLNRSAAYTFKCPDEKGFCPLCYGKISIVSWVVLISRSFVIASYCEISMKERFHYSVLELVSFACYNNPIS